MIAACKIMFPPPLPALPPFLSPGELSLDCSRPHLSLLVFKGHMAVHGLFDFLLETCGSPAVMGGSGGNSGVPGRSSSRRGSRGGGGGGRAGDVPLLLSREPFLNASLRSLKVQCGARGGEGMEGEVHPTAVGPSVSVRYQRSAVEITLLSKVRYAILYYPVTSCSQCSGEPGAGGGGQHSAVKGLATLPHLAGTPTLCVLP